MPSHLHVVHCTKSKTVINMNKNDILGLFLRCLGAWEVVQGIGSIPGCFFRAQGTRDAAIIGVISHSIAGLMLFFCAGFLVEWTYGTRPERIVDKT